jgi:hypothetical protein
MSSTINPPLLFQKTVAINSLAGKQSLFKMSGFFGENMFTHCFDCSFVLTVRNEAQDSSPITRTM